MSGSRAHDVRVRLGPEHAFIDGSRLRGGRASFVACLLLPHDFPLRRFLFIEPDRLHLGLPREVSETHIRHSKRYASP